MSTRPRPGPVRALASVGLVAVVALAVVVVTAPASHAAPEVRLVQPEGGARITQPTAVRVEVRTGLLEKADWVEARLVRDGEVVGQATRLSHQDGDRSGGTSTWGIAWDPSGGWMGSGAALRNGAYRVQARAGGSGLVSGGSTEWQGHGVTVSLPPAAPVLQGEASEDGQAVTLTWSEAAAPDFAFYRLERAPADGSFEAVTQITRRQDTAHHDQPESPGTWRYRVTAARSDGAGGHTTATSNPVSVDLGSPEATPSPTPSPSPETTPEDTGTDGRGDGSGDDSGSDEGGDAGQGSQSGSTDAGSGGEASQGGSGEGEADPGTLGFSSGDQAPPEPPQSSVPELQDEPEPSSQQPEPEPEPREPVTDVPSESSTFSRQLPYEPDQEGGQGGEQPDRADAPERPADAGSAGQGRPTPGGVANPGSSNDELAQSAGDDAAVITVGGRQVLLERVLPPMAGGLLLFVVAGHLLRLRRRLG